jgi:hypothetical protein
VASGPPADHHADALPGALDQGVMAVALWLAERAALSFRRGAMMGFHCLPMVTQIPSLDKGELSSTFALL